MTTSANSAAASVGAWQVLKQNSRFRRLWTAQLISAAGDWFNSVAVLGLVLQLTNNSGLAVSLVLLSSVIPSFFLIPIAGPFADRFDRRTLMIVTNLASTGIALLFMFVHSSNMLWLVYLASVLLVVSASFFAPASSASIPNIVSQEELFTANALSQSTWSIMVMVGSALGGIVSTLFGREVAFVVNAISFLLAALIIATLDIPSPKIEKKVTFWQDFRDGLTYLREYLPAVGMVAVKFGWGLAGGVIVLLSVFGTQVFKAGDAGIGALYSARGLGALVGPFLLQAIVGRNVRKLHHSIWIAFLLSGLGYLIFATSGWLGLLWLGCVALAIAHFGGGITWVISSVLLQLTTPDKFRGRVFAVAFGINSLTTSVSTLLYGLALQGGASPMTLAMIGAVIFILYGIAWAIVTSLGRFRIEEAHITG